MNFDTFSGNLCTVRYVREQTEFLRIASLDNVSEQSQILYVLYHGTVRMVLCRTCLISEKIVVGLVTMFCLWPWAVEKCSRFVRVICD